MEYMGLQKFKDIDKNFHESFNQLITIRDTDMDLIHQFPVYVGHVSIARYLFFYDLYKKCYELSGHLADVGTWKGASFFFMAKLVKLFEPYSATQVHGFEWFEGMKPEPGVDNPELNAKYSCSYQNVLDQINLQQLNDIAIIHNMDITKELDPLMAQNNHLRFKMVFVDCGIAKVLDTTLRCFWPRLVRGGILIMDHYNCQSSPQESLIVEHYIGKNYIRQFPCNRQPTAYIIKEHD